MNTWRSLSEKLSFCVGKLAVWGNFITGCFRDMINQCKTILKTLKERKDVNSINIIREERKKLEEIYAQKEVFWRQKVKQLWLKDGDQNIKFFHASAKKRRRVNHINTLRNADGDLLDWGSMLEDTIVHYFSSLFASSETE